MTQAEAQYLMHAVGKDPLIAKYLDNQSDAGYDMRQTIGRLPSCPSCERAALHHENGIICPNCGYKGAAKHKVRDYIHRGMYR
jgi:DNA-directed RNA polymerase subunit RPC12/RpoP